MEKLRYDKFLKSIVNRRYDTIGMENDLLENGKIPTFKIILTKGELFIENNLNYYRNKTYYYDFDIDDIIDLIINLLYEMERKTTNKLINKLKKNIDDLLEELEDDD